MSTYRNRLRTVNRLAGRAPDSTWEYIGGRGKPDDYYTLPWQQQQRLERELEETSTNLDRRPIAAEVLAVKMESARRGELGSLDDQLIERPAIAELLWWLQYWSFQDGGLATHVVAPLLEQEKTRLGFPELWDIKPANNGRFTDAQIRTLLAAAPDNVRGWLDLDQEGSIADIAYFNRDRLATPEAWLGQITTEIKHRLPTYLHELCQSPAVDFSGKHFTLIPDVIGRLIELMVSRSVIEQQSIAQTETFRRMGEEIEFAESQRGMAMVVGDSRLGKTVSAKARVRMRPGKRRHCELPSGIGLASMYRDLARVCWGMMIAPGVKTDDLRELIEYVFRVSRVTLLADEFHNVLPPEFTRRTQPRRLDWIRTALFDRGVPIVGITTPQNMECWRRFMSYTQYTQNQFRGRLDVEVFLSPQVSEEDIAAVARHVLKGCGDDAVELVIARALRCDMGLKVVDAIKRRAAWRAEKDGRSTFSDADLDGAWKELEPSFQHQPLSPERQAEAEAACKVSAARLQPAEKPVATRLQSPKISRGKRPALPAPKPRGESIPDLVQA